MFACTTSGRNLWSALPTSTVIVWGGAVVVRLAVVELELGRVVLRLEVVILCAVFLAESLLVMAVVVAVLCAVDEVAGSAARAKCGEKAVRKSGNIIQDEDERVRKYILVLLFLDCCVSGGG